MTAKIEEYIANCAGCTTYQKRHPYKPVISLLVPKQLWEAQAVGSNNIQSNEGRSLKDETLRET